MSSNTGNITITSTPMGSGLVPHINANGGTITWNPKRKYLTPRQHLFLIRMKRCFDSPIERGTDFRFSLGLNAFGHTEWAWRKGRDISEFLEEISKAGCYDALERDILNGIRFLWIEVGK